MKKRRQVCPHCGGDLGGYHSVSAPARGSLISYAPPPKPPKDERTTQAVDIPRAHAIDAGVVCGLLTAAGCAIADVSPADCMFAGIITASIVGGTIRAIASVADWRVFIWRWESMTGVDIDDDDVIGEPAPVSPQEPQQTMVYNSTRRKTDRQRFEVFVRDCATKSTGQNYWEQSRDLPREDYINWRDTLISLGWAGWNSKNSKNQGWGLLFLPDEIIAGMFRKGARPPRPTGAKEV